MASRPNPSLFYYAKENCYNTTALYSAHTLSYGGMDTFLIDPGNTDIARHRGGLGAKVVQDFCMDDRELLQYFKHDLLGNQTRQFVPVHGFSTPPPVVNTTQQPRESPWFALFHSCGTHLPGMYNVMYCILCTGYEEPGDTPSNDRWNNAIWRWDSVLGELLSGVNLNDTIVIITSDHGHNVQDDSSR